MSAETASIANMSELYRRLQVGQDESIRHKPLKRKQLRIAGQLLVILFTYLVEADVKTVIQPD